MTPARRSAGLRRSIALLLFAVFLGTGTTLPGADALLFHGDATAEHRPHIEPAGGCTSHADDCTLGRTATGAGAELAHLASVRAEPPSPEAAPTAPEHLPIAGVPAGLFQSRAPPVTTD